MVTNLNPNTPQLQVVDRLFAAYRTCDLNNAAPLMSKGYAYKPLHKAPGTADLTWEEHVALFGPMFAKFVKLEHIFHEVIEVPGKVVVQWTAVFTPPDGHVFESDNVAIIPLVEEDGEIKVLGFHHFMDPEKRSHMFKKVSERQIA